MSILTFLGSKNVLVINFRGNFYLTGNLSEEEKLKVKSYQYFL